MLFPFFLARRFYRSAHKDNKRRASSLAIRIATAGVAVGLAVMLISICVVKGFQREIRSKLTGFVSHIEVLDLNSFASPESFPIITDGNIIGIVKNTPGVEHVQRVSQKMGILKTDEAYQTIVLKGVGSDYDLSFIKSLIIKGRMPDFKAHPDGNDILISNKQARSLHIGVGSRVFTYFFADDIKLRRFTVAGIYETNLSQFDDYFVWAGRSTVNQLNGWQDNQSSALEVFVNDYENTDAVQALLAQKVNGKRDRNGAAYSTLSVKDNPRTSAVVQWLTLLDLNVWVILGLMAGVAGFTMISGLLILILERTRTIGVLKALGASNTRIRHIFMLYAAMIVGRGLLWGNLIGLGILLVQKWWGVVRLDPATYYVQAAPVEMVWGWIVGLNIGTMVACTLALVVPSFIISRISPARAVRYE